ncbi:hypothetical protein BGZ47_001924, partial [Haplosporangium gracile]
IRVLALFAITNTEQSRPVVMPFLTYHCPNLQLIKIKDPGSMPFATLHHALNASQFPDLRHLELDGVRPSERRGMLSIFPVYKVLLSEGTFSVLESPIISADSGTVGDVPQFVTMLSERYAKTLKTVRRLGSAGGICRSGQTAVDTVVITDAAAEALVPNSTKTCTQLDPTSKALPPSLSSSILNRVRQPSRLDPRPFPTFSTSSLSGWASTLTLTYLEINFRPSPNIMNERRYRLKIESFYRKLGELTVLVEDHC